MSDIGRSFLHKIKTDRVRAHAAEAAFFTILSFFPMLMLFLTWIQFTPIRTEQVIYIIEEITPFEIVSILKSAVEGYDKNTTALISWTLIIALWAAGKGVMGLSDGLNAVYCIKSDKNYIIVRIRSACYVFLTLLVLLVSICMLVFGYSIQEFLRTQFPVLNRYRTPLLIIPLLIAVMLLFGLFCILYSYLPYQKMKLKEQVPGAVFTAIAWTVFSFVFSIYLDLAENLSKIYGGLTTLAVAMLWLYFCMYLFFAGAEINSLLQNSDKFDDK